MKYRDVIKNKSLFEFIKERVCSSSLKKMTNKY